MLTILSILTWYDERDAFRSALGRATREPDYYGPFLIPEPEQVGGPPGCYGDTLGAFARHRDTEGDF